MVCKGLINEKMWENKLRKKKDMRKKRIRKDS